VKQLHQFKAKTTKTTDL